MLNRFMAASKVLGEETVKGGDDKGEVRLVRRDHV
jgi:hypothetical protein